MSSEWMKVMLDEITRKKVEAEQAQAEQDLRDAVPAPSGGGAVGDDSAPQ